MFILPQRNDKPSISFPFEDFNSIVLLGANGSGKTRLSVWIEKNMQNVHRISAQKSLSMPEVVRPSTRDLAMEEFLYGMTDLNKDWLRNNGKLSGRWGSNPATYLLNDFDKLLTLLHTEEYEESVDFKDKYEEGKDIPKPVTKLDIIQNIWEEVLPHRKLKKRAGKIEVYSNEKPDEIYNASQMSDGERLVFYFIGEIICAPKDSVIIVDEPENHLHTSIIKKLWDMIETVRSDCKLVFLTHDIDFAITRNKSKLIWLKSYSGDEIWDYEVIDDVENIPNDIYLEIIGSRNPILFIEGEKASFDYRIYQQLFKDFTIVPLGSCEKVIETTKAFNQLTHFHNLLAKGIIDRDRRTEEEINAYAGNQIFVPHVAEVENLFIVEDVIKIVATLQRKEPVEIFERHKEKVIALFENELHNQAYEYATYRVKARTLRELDGKFKSFKEFNENYSNCLKDNDNQRIFDEIYNTFQEFIKKHEYNNIIKVFNHKGLIAKSRVAESCGLMYKSYIGFILDVLKEDSVTGAELRGELRKYISVI